MQHLLDVGASLSGIKYFLDDGSEQLNVSIVQRLLDGKSSAGQLNPDRIAALSKLIGIFGEDSYPLQRLLAMESQRFSLVDVQRFLEPDQSNKSILVPLQSKKSILEAALHSPELNLTSKDLLDKSNLPRVAQFFHLGNSDAFQRIEEYQKQGSLSALRLSRYLSASPESRGPVIDRLLKEGASAARLNAQMSLSVLPDELAYQLSKDNEGAVQRVARVRNGLRLWNGGRQFADLLVERFESGGDLSSASIDKLILGARESASSSARNASAAGLSGSVRGLDADGQSATFARASDSVTSDFKDSHQSAAGDTTDGASHMNSNEAPISEAKTLEDAAREIRSAIPAEQPIVLLGRDSWPLLPALVMALAIFNISSGLDCR